MKSNAANNQGRKRSGPRTRFVDVKTGKEVQPSAAAKKRVAAARRKAK